MMYNDSILHLSLYSSDSWSRDDHACPDSASSCTRHGWWLVSRTGLRRNSVCIVKKRRDRIVWTCNTERERGKERGREGGRKEMGVCERERERERGGGGRSCMQLHSSPLTCRSKSNSGIVNVSTWRTYGRTMADRGRRRGSLWVGRCRGWFCSLFRSNDVHARLSTHTQRF